MIIKEASSTLPREAEGPHAPPPVLGGSIKILADAVAAWREVEATTHWHLANQARLDGIDFYVGPCEPDHRHLDGSIHLATSAMLGATTVAERPGHPFHWAEDWTLASIDALGEAAALGLFCRNYDRPRPARAD